MELLVATLAHMVTGRDADTLSYIRLISDTMHTAPGLLESRFYRSRQNDTYYFILTTWESSESWRRAQHDYSPKHLLLATTELLTTPPEQWVMSYIWGYSRPGVPLTLAAAHLTMLLPEQVEPAQQSWLQGVQQYTLQTTLAFAFLAQGIDDEATAPRQAVKTGTSFHQQGPLLLSFLHWGSDDERQKFYVDHNYRVIHTLVENTGATRILPLEPI